MSLNKNSKTSICDSKVNPPDQDKFDEIRRQAEKLVSSKDLEALPANGDDFVKLIHELQIYQIELELQNQELHHSQQELMKSQIRYTELYDSAPVGYITLNLKGVILHANLTFTGMLLTERSSLIKKPLSSYIYFQDQDILYRHLRDLSVLKTRQICELRMQKVDGAPFYVQLESTLISDGYNHLDQSRTVVIDISERKQMENNQHILEARLRQTHKMKSICTVTGGIAHDFNNILQVIIGNVSLAFEYVPEWNPAHTNLEAIQKSAQKAKGIVRTLLNFSQKSDQELKPIRVDSLFDDIYSFLRSAITANIEIRKILSDNDVMILADKIQIGQILMNLCTNAAQAMGKNGGIIEIKVAIESLTQKSVAVYPDIDAGDYIKIKVSDTGPGIDPEIVDQIFDPYFTTQDVGKGSGMGLAVVHGIVKSHDGVVTVKTKQGAGAVFSILLPVTKHTPEVKD